MSKQHPDNNQFNNLQSPELAPYWLTALIESADDAIISKTLDGIITSWNKGAQRIFGYTAEEVIGKPVTILIPEGHLDEESTILAKLRAGQRIEHYETVRITKARKLVDISLTVSPIIGPNGTIIGASKIARDITDQQQARRALDEASDRLKLALNASREQAEALRTLNEMGRTISAELDLHKTVQAVTNAATDLTRARFGSFFYNVLNEAGASYMLYTLAGVSAEMFTQFPLPRATDLFGPTFRGEGVVRIDDVKNDPRYGKNSPYYGMPEGHLPVTSYLAVPVISRSGEVLGGLFFGHPDPGVFTERDEIVVSGLASQAAVAMDNARLYEAAKKARAEAERAASDNERLYRQAEESSRLKEEFLATISHELRTPLSAILGWARMLRLGQLSPEDSTKALETIERNARAQAQLVDDLLDVSRIITGKLRMDVRPADPNSFIEAAVEAVKPAAEAKGVRVQKVFDTGPISIPGDPVRLQQVVWNLLSNAIKFTPRGGRVQIRSERVNSHLEIVVSDTGQGISVDFLPHVFDRFRQADQKTSRQHGGMGLGLAIVRHLVEMHGGTVRANSEGEDKGATFTVMLPISPVYQVDSSGSRVHPGARDLLPPNDVTDRLDGVRVLIVDDEADTRELLKQGLEYCGAQVRVAGSAAEAIAALVGSVPDILISDIGMPGTDGYDLIRQVRGLPAAQGGKVAAIALTAYTRVEDRLHALRAGYDMHVPKPVELAELVAVAASVKRRSV